MAQRKILFVLASVIVLAAVVVFFVAKSLRVGYGYSVQSTIDAAGFMDSP